MAVKMIRNTENVIDGQKLDYEPLFINFAFTEERIEIRNKISGNSGWDVNGTRLFGSFHWTFSGINGISEKVVPFSRWKLPNGNLCSIYRFISKGFFKTN